MRTIRSCLAGVGCLTLLALGGGAAWTYWPEIQEWWSARSANVVFAVEPSEELAADAEARLRSLFEEGGPVEVRLTEAEVQSLVLYRVAPTLPPGVSEPLATLQDSTVQVSALLDLEQLAASIDSEAAGRLQEFIGDTARVTARLHPRVAGPARGELSILRLQAGLFPVPPLLIPGMITQLGFSTAPGNPRAMAVEIPPEIQSVTVEAQELVVRLAAP
ncbi:MAG: hypothetical protein V3W24_02310 [Gemmatimonadota bacterium]